MSRIATLLLLLSGFFVSCTSEYEECLSEAKQLQQRYHIVEETQALSPSVEMQQELLDIQSEIDYLAQVSGNEYLFFQDLKR